jgi:hypothetical protein
MSIFMCSQIEEGMWMRVVMLSVGLGIALMGAHGCGGVSTRPGPGSSVQGDRRLVAQSEGIKPLWIQECPTPTKETLSFCGEAHYQANQHGSCAEAYADALAKLRHMIGQRVGVGLVGDPQHGYRFQVQGIESEPINLRGVSEGQRWWEEYENGGRTVDCYLLLSYPKLEYDLLMVAARKALVKAVFKAGSLLHEAKQDAEQGSFAQAIGKSERAVALLSAIKEPMELPDGTSSALLAEQAAADLKHYQALQAESGKTAVVVMRLTLDGKEQSDTRAHALLSSVKGWLAERGLRLHPGLLSLAEVASVLSGEPAAANQIASRRGAGLVLVLDIASTYKGQEESVFYAYAQGTVRLIRTSDGRELESCAVGPAKGGMFSSRADALKKALDTLVKEGLRAAVKEALNKI